MTRKLIIIATTTLASALLALSHAQTTGPTDADRLAQTAKEFGMSAEQLDGFVRRELGDPIVVDGDLIVGVRRDPAGRVTGVQITTPKRNVRFNRAPDDKNPGLRYSHAELTESPNMSVADDIDGDARIDRIMLTPPGEKLPHILLRISTAFVQVSAVADGRFKTAEGQVVAFSSAQHEWVPVN